MDTEILSAPEPPQVQEFREWFKAHGGFLHPAAQFVQEPSGISVRATEDIPKDTKIVSCPFALAITPQECQNALNELLGVNFSENNSFSTWTEYQLIATYIVLHWILEDPGMGSSLTRKFRHLPYIHILPHQDALRTPRYFTPAEKELIKYTDVGKSADQREKQQETMYDECRQVIANFKPELTGPFSSDRFFAACTYISSRAFPSTVLSPTPSLQASPDSYPVLLPGVDSLNHARGHPVTWLVDHVSLTSESTSTSPPCEISLVPHVSTPAGQELLNNYGPKSNAELLLGYGFTIPHNPQDIISFESRGQNPHPGSSKRIEVGRDARGIEPLWEQMKDFTKMSMEDDETGPLPDWQLNIEAATTFHVFLGGIKQKIPRIPTDAPEDVRPDVLEMSRHYIKGIMEIVDDMVAFADAKREEGQREAAGLGIEYQEEESDDQD